MMVGNQFEEYVHQNFPKVFIPQNLLEVAKGIALKFPFHQQRHVNGPLNPKPTRPPGLCLLIDGEKCLDRFYGGFFTDWACGGQWKRVLEFIRVLFTTMKSGNIHVVVFFNGALEEPRMKDWKRQQTVQAERVRQVIQHVRRKWTPPPKVLWMPPAGLRTWLRLTLRYCMIPVHVTLDDHLQEVMTFLRENSFDALLADGGEYLFCEPPKLYSASSLRLTFKRTLEVKELVLEDIAKLLDLHPNRLSLIPAILGNFMLPRDEFLEFYDKLLPTATLEEKNNPDVVIPTVIAFIRNLPNVDDLLAVGRVIFKDSSDAETKAQLFHHSVRYYANATKEGFHKYFKPKSVREAAEAHKFASEEQDTHNDTMVSNGPTSQDLAQDMENGEAVEEVCDRTEASLEISASDAEETPGVSDAGVRAAITAAHTAYHSAHSPPVGSGAGPADVGPDLSMHFLPSVQDQVLRAAAHRHFRGLMHPWIYQILSKAEIKLETNLEEGSELPFGWKVWRGVRQSIYAILFDLNHKTFLLSSQKSRFSPNKKWMKAGGGSANIKPPNKSVSESCEEEIGGSPLPQSSNEPAGKYPQELSTRIFVKEWVLVPRKNLYERPEMVEAVALPWTGIPTLKRLWFERHPFLREKRMKAFLSCFLSDTPLMINNQYVPQHLLILCCVLRYMIAYTDHPQRILEEEELNAFLAAALSPQRFHPDEMQSIPVQSLTPRGVQLANLLMQGVEHAVVANDACGGPVPWAFLCPWLFFDGKLFQLKLHIAMNNPHSLLDLCNGDIEQMGGVERMKRAIVEGLEFLFHLPRPQSLAMMNPVMAAQIEERIRAVARGRGMMGRREILARGGQLKIGGVVVSEWGGNVDKFNNQHNPPHINNRTAPPPDVTSIGQVGNRRGGRGTPAPRSLGVVRLGSARLYHPSSTSARLPQPGHPQGSLFRAPPPPPPPIPPQTPSPYYGVQQGSPAPSYYPMGAYVGTPITTGSSLPQQQVGVAAYGMAGQHAYQVSTRGRGGVRGGRNNGGPRPPFPKGPVSLPYPNFHINTNTNSFVGGGPYAQGNWTGTL